jgi:O-antigen ligase
MGRGVQVARWSSSEDKLIRVPFRSPMLESQHKVLRTLESAFVVITILFMSNSLRFFYTDMQPNEGTTINLAAAQDGNRTFQMIMLACYGIGGLVLMINFKKAVALALKAWPLVLFLGVVAASVAWSANADMTIRRGGALVLTSAFAFYMVLRFPGQQLAALIVASTIGIVWINFAAMFIVPEVAIQASRDGALRGLLGHKNDFGQMMLVCGLALLTLLRGRPPIVQLLMTMTAALAFGMAILSDSATAIIVLFLTFALVIPVTQLLGTQIIAKSVRYTLFAAMGLAGTAAMVVLLFTVGLDALGKDATLTNRTLIWDSVWQLMMAKQPLGYGYGAFWEGSSTGQTLALFWNIAHAHNGYLDLLLDLGIVGFGTLLLALFTTIAKMVGCYSDLEDQLSRFYLLLIVALLIFNFVSHAFPNHSSVQWLIMSLAMVAYAPGRRPVLSTAGKRVAWRRRPAMG